MRSLESCYTVSIILLTNLINRNVKKKICSVTKYSILNKSHKRLILLISQIFNNFLKILDLVK